MISLVFLLAIAAATPDPATLTLSLDLQQPAVVSRVTLELRSLRDGTITTYEQLWSPLDLQKQTIPPGVYELTIIAAGHRPVTRRVAAVAGETVALGQVALTALPRILGRVTAGGAPVPNATIRTTEAVEQARTGADGRFALEVTSQRPRFLIVEAAGLGTQTIEVPQTNSDSVLSIELERPSSVEITVRRPPRNHESLEVQIGVKGHGAMYWLGHRTLAPRQSKAKFDALASGAYIVFVRGKGEMEQLASKVVLGRGDRRRMTMAIDPMRIETRVLVGGEPVPNATAILLDTDNSIMPRFTTDAGGRWEGEVWQRSEYVVRVMAPGMAIATTHATFDSPRMTIDLPALIVRGRVLDARTGAPVPAASLYLRTHWEDKSATAPLTADGEGHFVFRGVQPGRQQLIVRADGYLMHDDLEFELSEQVPVRELELKLDPGVHREITVRDGRGAPVANTNLLCADEEHIRSSAVTDEEGHAVAPLPADGCTLYAIPDGNSFALTRVTRAMIDSGAALPVSLAQSTGRLEVVTRTEQGQPVGNVSLLVRYNGAIFPPEVVRAIERAQGLAFRTDDGGVATLPALPLGTYELWPYRTEHEAAEILASAYALEAPIQLNLKSGENRVAVKLRAR